MGGADSPWHYAMYISIVLYNVSIFIRLRRSSDSTFRAFFHVEQRNIHTVLPEKTACLEKRAIIPPRARRKFLLALAVVLARGTNVQRSRPRTRTVQGYMVTLTTTEHVHIVSG